MANCRDFTYIIAFTDNSKPLIQLPQNALNQELVDIALVGKTRLAYGEVFNENVLHLLEHFASSSSTTTPNTASTVYPILQNSTFGQLWFNKQNSTVSVYSSVDQWISLLSPNTAVGNSGTILDGEYLPLPNGVDSFENCQIIVTPFYFSNIGTISVYNVRVNSEGLVTAKYTVDGIERSGKANYLVLSVAGLPSGLNNFCSQPTPTITPTPTG